MDRPTVAPWSLGTLGPARGLGLKRRLCSASSKGSVEPPWAQVSPNSLPWERRSELRTRLGTLCSAHPAVCEADPKSGRHTSRREGRHRAALPVPPAPNEASGPRGRPVEEGGGGGVKLLLSPACPAPFSPVSTGCLRAPPRPLARRALGNAREKLRSCCQPGGAMGQGCCWNAGLSPSPAQALGPADSQAVPPGALRKTLGRPEGLRLSRTHGPLPSFPHEHPSYQACHRPHPRPPSADDERKG